MTPCRRTVLKGAAATCGVGLLAACGGGDGAASGDPDAPLVQLDEIAVGSARNATAGNGDKVIVTRPSEGEALAFSAVCPHQGCTVAPDGELLTCPCHGSRFELDGSVVQGPAEKDLEPYAVQVVDGQVLPA